MTPRELNLVNAALQLLSSEFEHDCQGSGCQECFALDNLQDAVDAYEDDEIADAEGLVDLITDAQMGS